MKSQIGRGAAGATGLLLLAAALIAGSPAGAAPTGAVPFGQANFHGYATGSEVHLGAVGVGTTRLADVDQAFSGASTSTAGLTGVINSETTEVVQPAEPASVKAYGTGSGLEIGLAQASIPTSDANQIKLAGKAQQIAPPNSTATTAQIGPINIPPVLSASLLTGRAAAVFDPTQCPIGEPLSYGFGNAANVNALSLIANSPTLNTAASGTSTAQTQSYTFLSPNGDGTFGLTSASSEIVAPITVNLLGLFTVKITIAGKDPSQPITLDATTTGGASGGAVTLHNAGLLTATLTPAGGTPVNIISVDLSNPSTLGPHGFLHVDINTSALGPSLSSLSSAIAAILNGTALPPQLAGLFGPGGPLNGILGMAGSTVSSVLSKLANLSLGSLDIDATPHAIGHPPLGSSTITPPVIVGGTSASGAIDLVNLNLGLSGSVLGLTLPPALTSIQLANLSVGHLETAANLSAPIECGIPVIKTANPTSVTAGHPFTYTIQIPDPAKLALLDCDLVNITATDTIKDLSGAPTFQVNSVSNGGTINQTSPTASTVTWTGLTYKVAAHGSPPNPPITLTINVTVPANSPSGTIEDIINATGTAENCKGGGSNITNIGGINGTVLTGTFTLQQPGVTAVPGAPTTPTTVKAKLPFTGAIGGPWQPIAGLGVLALGGGALALVRRSRRRLAP